MHRPVTLALAADELIAVCNALNYFGYAIDGDECSTLLGCDQALARELFERFRAKLEEAGAD